MRILQIGKFYPPIHGGMESVLEALSSGLQARGHLVTVLCANNRFSTEESESAGVKVIRLASLGVFFSQPILPTFFYQLIFLSKVNDLIHVHSPNPWVELFCIFLRKPMIVTYHADVVRQKKLLFLYSHIRNYFLYKAKRVVVASSKLKLHSVALKAIQNKIDIIPFGLPLKQFEANAEVCKFSDEIRSTTGNYYLFVGRLVAYKGLPVLFRALKKAKQKLVIIGVGPEESNLRALAKELELESRIVFVGRVESQDLLSAYFRSATAVVLPSVTRAEAFGMVLIEALGWGRPIISTDLDTGTSEVNENERTGLVVPAGDDQALAYAIQKISENSLWANELGENGKKKFIEKYEVNSMCKQYEKIYESVRA